jgi:short-subunit dehydrogenase
MEQRSPGKAKRVVIVGASSGIGKELALLYASANWVVGITGRRVALLEEIQKQFPEKITVRSFDNTTDDVAANLNLLISELGGMDLLIISSGGGYINTALDTEIEEGTVDLNVWAWTTIAVYAFNYFRKQGHGHLAAITSIAAIRGEGRAPSYNASKAYQAHYLEGLRKLALYEKLKIYITDIQPGFVKTVMAKSKNRFWEAPAEKAARQIFQAIERKRQKVYVTKRWWIIAQLLKIAPGWIYNRI